MAASMAGKLIIISMESKREKTVRTEGLPSTIFTDGKRGGAATVMENEGLAVVS